MTNDPLKIFLMDLLGENLKEVTIAHDNASPELPEGIMHSSSCSLRLEELENPTFSSSSLESMASSKNHNSSSSRWDSMANLKTAQGLPTLPRRSID
jgi:hypothetical protein